MQGGGTVVVVCAAVICIRAQVDPGGILLMKRLAIYYTGHSCSCNPTIADTAHGGGAYSLIVGGVVGGWRAKSVCVVLVCMRWYAYVCERGRE